MSARRQRDLEASLDGDTHRPIGFGLVVVITAGGILLALATIVVVVAQTQASPPAALWSRQAYSSC
jgi:hypothetical protein